MHRFLLLGFLLFTAGLAIGQPDASSSSGLGNPRDADAEFKTKTLRDQMEKMRIAKEKQEFSEMIERGDKALALSEELERTIESKNQLNRVEIGKLETLEKIVKKIRSDLGGRDEQVDEVADSDVESVETPSPQRSNSLVDAFRTLKSQTVKLVGELKKTTRFSISAAAIRSTNAVLRMTRFLRLLR